jgi:hypothetical protein
VLDAGGRIVEVARPAEPGEIGTALLRPEDVTLSPGRPETGGSSARNHLAGRVLRVAASGPYVSRIVDCGFPLVALVTQRSVEMRWARDGTSVTRAFQGDGRALLRGWRALTLGIRGSIRKHHGRNPHPTRRSLWPIWNR